MSKTISVIYKNSEQNSFITTGLYLIYALLGATGTVLSFASCFHLEKDIWFYLVPVLFTVLSCSVFLIERIYIQAFLVFECGILLYAFMNWKKMVGGFITTANIIIEDVNESYQMGFEKFAYGEIEKIYRENDLFLIVAVIFITLLISFFVLGYASALGCIISSLPFTIFGIFFDLFPKLIFLVMSVTFWIVSATLRASGRKGRRRSDAAAYNALFVAVSVLVIFCVSQKVLPQEKYHKTPSLEEIKVFLNEYATQITSTVFNGEGEGTGANNTGIGHGEFGDVSEIHFTGHTMLEVKVPYIAQNIYLKGPEYNEYVGNGWNNNQDWFDSYFQDTYERANRGMWPQNITSSLLMKAQDVLGIYNVSVMEYFQLVKQYEIEINNINDQEYGYAPYGAVIEGSFLYQDVLPDMEGMKNYKYEVYTADEKEFLSRINTEWIISYMESVSEKNPANWYEAEEFYNLAVAEDGYAAYVRKAYTQVPENLQYLLMNYAPVTVEYNYEDTMGFVHKIQKMFLQDYAYTLAPGKVPDGRDGVEYFLTENKKGYCVYFATAATLIFRQAGIPARYVEGYVITPDMAKINRREVVSFIRNVGDEAITEDVEYVTVTVPDNKAHAWVEIYVSGYGWIPIEVTPGYYSSNDLGNEQEETQSKEETTAEREGMTETVSKEEDDKVSLEEGEGFDGKALGKMILFLTVFMVFAVTIAVVVRNWYKNGRGKFLAIVDEERGLSAKERACLAWWYIEEIMKFIKMPIPENITFEKQKQFLKENTEFFSKRDLNDKIDNIIKAYYGNENLTDEEITGIAQMIGDLRKETCESLSTGRQLCFKYIKRL